MTILTVLFCFVLIFMKKIIIIIAVSWASSKCVYVESFILWRYSFVHSCFFYYYYLFQHRARVGFQCKQVPNIQCFERVSTAFFLKKNSLCTHVRLWVWVCVYKKSFHIKLCAMHGIWTKQNKTKQHTQNDNNNNNNKWIDERNKYAPNS